MTTASDTIVVVCGADGAYARALGIMLQSLCDRLDPLRALELHVLDGGLGETGRDLIAAATDRRTALHWHRPDRVRFAGLPVWGRMTPATYDKLLAVDLLAPGAEKAIWLDADLLLLDDLAKIWDLDLEGRSALAAQDAVVPCLRSRFGVASEEANRHPPETKYFNAGVLLISPRRWREREVVPRALAYLKRHRATVSFWDQEGLNAALAGDWLELEPRWNVNVDEATRQGIGRDDTERLRAEASLLHYCGRQKPWRYPGRSASFALYYEVVDRTRAAGWRPAPTWTWRVLDLYARSPLRLRLRPILRPIERFWMAWEKRLSRRYLTAAEVGAV